MPNNKPYKNGRDFYRDLREKQWMGLVEWESAKEQHKLNLKTLEAVQKWRENPNRALSVLMVHGSGRHPEVSCAKEMSNSQLLLERGFELAKAEFDKHDVEENRLILREMVIEPCNNCVSTCSALCNFSCTCFPLDDMTVQAYPMMMWADVVLISTGVNQSMVSSRTKMFLDRLISLDGGYYMEELPIKDANFRDKMIKLSQEQPVYDQRLFGRVGGYIITSKDQDNKLEDGLDHTKYTYEDLVCGSLKSNFSDYGIFHADPYCYVAPADPHVEYSYDKVEYNKEEHAEKAKEVALAALELAWKFRQNPPKFKGGARVNRT